MEGSGKGCQALRERAWKILFVQQNVHHKTLFQEELFTRVPMLKSCSRWLRGRFREGLSGIARKSVENLLFGPQDVVAQTSQHRQRREANEFRFQSIPVPTRTPEEEVTRRALAAPEQSAKGIGFNEHDKS